MNVLDLFSGIGGFSLGLERAGMRTVAFCEIDPYCRAVLRKHWPDVSVFGDVRELTAEALAEPSGARPPRESQPRLHRQLSNGFRQRSADVICGGFPCQDISVAGKGAGIDGARSGLWSEYARIIGEIRPRYVIVENVAALLGRGIERVLGDLAALGFDAEWHCIPAFAVGAPHRRDRVWIVAYPDGGWKLQSQGSEQDERRRAGNGSQDVADANGPRLEGRLRRSLQECAEQRFAWAGDTSIPNAESTNASEQRAVTGGVPRGLADSGWWQSEPDVGRVANGVPFRVDRLRALGTAIVPQIAEIIGKAIMEMEGRKNDTSMVCRSHQAGA